MCPNATLRRIHLALLESPNNQEELIEACHDLRDWLGKGGFAPRWEDYPLATTFFRAWISA